MSPLHRRTDDPVRRLPWRTRWAWRRTARYIVADHVTGLLSQLSEFQGLAVHCLAPTAAGIVRLIVPGWTVTLAGVAAGPQAALFDAVERSPCHLSAAGKYGRFWWVAVGPGRGSDVHRTVVFGSHLVVTAIEDGRPRVAEPERGPFLVRTRR